MAASEATVQDGTYKIQRPFVFVTKDGAELSEAAQAFIDFATSDAASELIVNAGAVPVAKGYEVVNSDMLNGWSRLFPAMIH